MTDSLDNITVELSRTYNDVISKTTAEYLDGLDKNNLPSPRQIEAQLISDVNDIITFENMMIPSIEQVDANGNPIIDRNGNPKRIPSRKPWKTIERLLPSQIAEILVRFHHVIRINAIESNVSNENEYLAVYCAEGENKGLYEINMKTLQNIITSYDYALEQKKFEEVCFILQSCAPRKKRNDNRDLIAVNNGIFDYQTKTLHSFTPDIVFLAKSHVNYNPNAVLTVIHNDKDNTDWDIESWMSDINDDPEIVELLWQMLGAIIRPFVRWNHAIWLYSNTGNNGKGTLCELMRQLCGEGSHTSISLAEFSQNFALQPLIHCNAIIVDENDVGAFLDKLAALKAVVTNDIVRIDIKHKEAISFRFWGIMVQCINDLPRIKDKSDSFYRRQIIVPMDKCFTGIERSYIKNDYMSRPEVLEYVLKKVLHSNYYELKIPGRCVSLLDYYKEMNDPVREFLNEFKTKFVWDFLPMEFLYELYKSWYLRYNPCGKPEGKTAFKKQLEILLLEPYFSKYWYIVPNPIRIENKTNGPEPLISQYNLENWKNPHYTGKDVNKICVPSFPTNRYRGIMRRPNFPVEAPDDNTVTAVSEE